MNQKFQFLKKGFTVIDLGSAPGGWCQVASDAVRSLPPLDSPLDPRRKTGKVIGVDLKYMQPIAGVTLLENSDITKESTFKELQRHLNGKFANVILCDMANNSTGISFADHCLVVGLCKTALDVAKSTLMPGGTFICKVLNGSSEKELLNCLIPHFEKVVREKPQASHKDSREFYYVCLNHIKPNPVVENAEPC